MCDKFLNYSIALECLLIKKDDKGSKTNKIVDRAAFIIWGSAASAANKKVVKDLYELRGKIVHTGLVDIASEKVEDMQMIAMSCLFFMASRANKWKDANDLKNEIENIKSIDNYKIENIPSASTLFAL